jgi:hypothetical protein
MFEQVVRLCLPVLVVPLGSYELDLSTPLQALQQLDEDNTSHPFAWTFLFTLDRVQKILVTHETPIHLFYNHQVELCW